LGPSIGDDNWAMPGSIDWMVAGRNLGT